MSREFTLLFDRELAAKFAVRAELTQRDLQIASERVQRSGTIYAGEARAILLRLEDLRSVLEEGLKNLDADATASGKGGA